MGAAAKEQQELEEQKERNYGALLSALEANTIPKGTPATQIKTVYGAPDDLIRSGGSSSGTLEIWHYGKHLKRDSVLQWRPIRLYFNEGNLVDWNY